MKSNELRVGNYVLNPYKNEVFKVRGFDIGALDDGMDCESMQPIPLTPEILEKAGFVKNRQNEYLFRCSQISIYPFLL